jgi:hypothetical protein
VPLVAGEVELRLLVGAQRAAPHAHRSPAVDQGRGVPRRGPA